MSTSNHCKLDSIASEAAFVEKVKGASISEWFLTDNREKVAGFRHVSTLCGGPEHLPKSFKAGGRARARLLNSLPHETRRWKGRGFIKFGHSLESSTPKEQEQVKDGEKVIESTLSDGKRKREPKLCYSPSVYQDEGRDQKRKRIRTEYEIIIEEQKSMLRLQDKALASRTKVSVREREEMQVESAEARREAKRAKAQLSRLQKVIEKRRRESAREVLDALTTQFPENSRHKRRQASNAECLLALQYEERWKGSAISPDKIARAAINRASAESGFAAPFASPQTLAIWKRKGGHVKSTSRKAGRPSISDLYSDALLLHYFRRAEHRLCGEATFEELAQCMKNLGEVDEQRFSSISKSSLHRWFQRIGGKIGTVTSRPFLTTSNKASRVNFFGWVLESLPSPYFYLDEKWFFLRSGRTKAKYIEAKTDLGEAETAGIRTRPRSKSRRFTTKVMYLGVVCCPKALHFDGKVSFHRVSKEMVAQKKSRNTHFLPDAARNQEFLDHWREYVTDTMSSEQMASLLITIFDLEVSENRLDFFRRRGESGKLISLELGQSFAETGFSKMHWEICIVRLRGDRYQADCSCDGEWMAKILEEKVGPEIRMAADRLGFRGQLAFCQFDNAGGHGSKAVVARYERILLEKFKVKIIWQPSNSPESNCLDLGVWMSLQSDVNKAARGLRQNESALNAIVQRSWNQYSGERMRSVFEKLKDIAREVIEAGGDNTTVERTRGVAKKRAIAQRLAEEETVGLRQVHQE